MPTNLHVTPEMNQPIPQTIEADLIKIRTMKRKHADSILEPVGFEGTHPSETEFLAYIHQWDGILARRKDNGHLVIIRAIRYYSHHMEDAPDYEAARAEAYQLVHQLPQLFLD